MFDATNLIDNTFLRQYELKIGAELATLEYSQQERKIFLTKLNIPEVLMSDSFLEGFIKVVLENIIEKEISVVPTSPPVAKFIRRNRRYRKMLPVGIRI
ncbi:MAG: N-acetyltransferase [Formosa sp.]|jgi:hypothetical protein|nr:N-acetyltransferase [Formosa sp.]MDA9640239.1 N-acetyltransferase [Flavobacteriaceae bacterium]MDC0382307.1 N-acetyltransferase [Flavobacteriaceae bacterium]MDC0462772.1 N-acetyltransferase [Flavobacteriaceae bacterium]|tara:strand:+ start:4065 stop:4361 length:297 start_codon:yes stop_codon:yes gene_type:complete